MTSGGSNVVATGRLIFDASAVRAGVAGAHASLSTMYDVIRNNWWGIRAIGDAFQSTGAVATSALGIAAKAAIGFESAMAGVARTTADAQNSSDVTSKSVQDLAAQLQHIAEIRPVDLNVLTDIAEQAGALGIKRQDVAAFTQTIVDLISTTNLTQDSAVQLAKVANIFGLSGDQFKRMGSAIYQVGVNTAATEQDIVDLTVRLAPAAKQFGLTTAQTVGLSAATLSLGVQSEAAGTSLSRFFQQMERAASGVDPGKMEAFSQVLGVSNQQFQQMEKNDPSGTLVKFINALTQATKAGGDTTQILDSLGITEQREIRTINALVEGNKRGADSYLSIQGAFKQATDAYNNGNRASAAAEQQNKTLGAQLHELRNIVQNVAISFGQGLAPQMGFLVARSRDLTEGIAHLPGPFRTAASSVLGVVAGMGALGGLLILILPRLSLAANAYRSMSASMAVLTAAQQANTIASGNQAKGQIALAFATGQNYRALLAQQTADARSAELIQVRSQLTKQQVAIIEQQAAVEDLENRALAVVNGTSSENIGLIYARIRAKEAEMAATDLNIVALKGEVAALETTQVQMGAMATVAAVAGRALGSLNFWIAGATLLFAGITTALGIFGHASQDAAIKQQQLDDAIKHVEDDLNKETLALTANARAGVSNALANDKIDASGKTVVETLDAVNFSLNRYRAALIQGQKSDVFKSVTKDLSDQETQIAANSELYQKFGKAFHISLSDVETVLNGNKDSLDSYLIKLNQLATSYGLNTAGLKDAIDALGTEQTHFKSLSGLLDYLKTHTDQFAAAQKRAAEAIRGQIPDAANKAGVSVKLLTTAVNQFIQNPGRGLTKALEDNGIHGKQLATILGVLKNETVQYSNATKTAAGSNTQLDSNMQSVEGVLERTHGRVNQVIRDYIALALVQQGVIGTAHSIGVNTQQLIQAVINGKGPLANHINLLIAHAIAAGGDAKQLNHLRNVLDDLSGQYNGARGAARQTILAQDDLQRSLQSVGAAMNSASGAGRTYQQVLDDASTAAASLVQDNLAVGQATRDLASAERNLATAEAAHARLPHDLAEGEAELAVNRLKVADASAAVTDAERNLRHWREDARAQIQQDSLDQVQAQESYRASVQKVHDAEAALRDLRQHGEEEHLQRLADLTNKLRDAQNNLTHANITAQDAQFNLNSVIAEGGSARDVANARQQLKDATLGVADANSAVGAARKDLQDERHYNLTKAIKDAELALRDANLESAVSLNKLHEATRKLNDDRRDLRTGRDYRAAEEALKEAELQLYQAQDQVYQSQQKLKDIHQLLQNDYNLADAHAQVESAAVSLADAQVTLKEDLEKADGKVVSAKEHLDNFRSTLNGIASDIGGKVGSELDTLASKLNLGDIRAHITASMSGDDVVIRKAHNIRDAVDPLTDSKGAPKFIVLNGVQIGIRGASNTAPNAVAQGGIITGGTTFQYGANQQGIAGEGATPEAIMPLHDLWHNLAPLATIAAADQHTNQLLTQVVRELGGTPGTAAGGSVTHHREQNIDIKVDAHTDVDVQQIGRDIAWHVRAVS